MGLICIFFEQGLGKQLQSTRMKIEKKRRRRVYTLASSPYAAPLHT
jgi:hypothetical protein